jgi:hypothetical protein
VSCLAEGLCSPREGEEIVFFSEQSRPELGASHCRVEWVSGAPSLWINRLGRDANHLSPFSAEVKNKAAIFHFSNLSGRTVLPSRAGIAVSNTVEGKHACLL